MSFLLMPITLLIKQYFHFGYMYLAEIDLYLFLLLALAVFISRNRNKMRSINMFRATLYEYVKDLINFKVILYIIGAIIIQSATIVLSYKSIGENIYNVNPVTGLLAVIILGIVFFLHYFVIGIMIENKKDIVQFIKGIFAMTVIVLVVVYAQFLYILFPNNILGYIMEFFGKFFEQRNQFVPQWYNMGSYVQSMHRINGFFSEPAKLAAFLCIICLPFILASIKNKYSVFSPEKRFNPYLYYTLLSAILIILLYAKTSTGMVAIVLAVGIFWLTLPKKRKVTSGIVIILALGAIVLLYLFNNSVHQLINEYTIGKSASNSTDNRLGGTIGLLTTFLHHPILGVGQSYVDYYQYQNIPKWARDNWEFKSFTTVRHSFPIYSILIGWFVQYGIIICITFFIYIVKLKKSISNLVNAHKKTPEYGLFKTINDAGLYFIIFYFVLLLLTFGWNESAFFIMFFFFVVFNKYLKKSVRTMRRENRE